MLILTRRLGEWLELRVPGRETPIRVCLTELRNKSARIGIDADSDIVITRSGANGDTANLVCGGVGLATTESE